MADALSAVTCAIYAILAIPVLFILVKHGREGWSGWLFLFIFCTIRIVSGALAINKSSPAASIIANIGLSPLLLASSGILHEARNYRIRNLDKKLESVLALAYHIMVIGGVALTAAGSAKLQSHEQPIDKAEKLVRAGMAILTLSWAALVGWAGLSFIAPRAKNDIVVRGGTVLLASVSFSLAFIGVRVFYSLVALCTMKASLNPTTGSLVIRVVLGFLPELIATLTYIAAGIKTQSLAKLPDNRGDGFSLVHNPNYTPYA